MEIGYRHVRFSVVRRVLGGGREGIYLLREHKQGLSFKTCSFKDQDISDFSPFAGPFQRLEVALLKFGSLSSGFNLFLRKSSLKIKTNHRRRNILSLVCVIINGVFAWILDLMTTYRS
jgi:hypothetical protein